MRTAPVALTASARAEPPGSSQGPARALGTFSDFRYHGESGDLLGTEVKIVRSPRGYVAIVQVAAGEPNEPTIVPVTVTGDSVVFAIRIDPQRIGVFKGTVASLGLEGTLETDGFPGRRMTLPRKCGYWDR